MKDSNAGETMPVTNFISSAPFFLLALFGAALDSFLVKIVEILSSFPLS